MQHKGSLSRESAQTLWEQMEHLLMLDMASGRLVPGRRLPSVRQLGARFGVSRDTANRALVSLREKGLIEILPGRGAFLLPESGGRASTRTIALVMDMAEPGIPPEDMGIVYGRLFGLLEQQARGSGYHLLTSHICYRDPGDRRFFESIPEKVDGVLIIGLSDPDFCGALRELPAAVSIMANLDNEAVDEVGVDNRKSYFRAVRYLLECGRRRLLYIDGPGDSFQKRERLQGCMEAFERFGSGEQTFAAISACGWSTEDARASFLDYAASLDGKLPDGIAAVNDAVALGVLQGCRRMGLRVPGDCAVLGGKNSLEGASSDPALSTIDCCFEDIAPLAFRRLFARMNGEKGGALKSLFNGSVIERSSTRL